MQICLVEPFFTGSHRQWAEGLQKHSRHEIQLLTLPGRHWKWRMHGGAVALASEFSQTFNQVENFPQLIIATDFLDVPTFRGLLPPAARAIPIALYFHENQLTYPWSPTDEDVQLERDNHYAFINYTSCLASEKIFFNSRYHQFSFLDALPEFLNQFPDHQELENIELIKKKSKVLSLGMKLIPNISNRSINKETPVLVWNHRWEYDKTPEEFFETLIEFQEEKVNFKLIVLGEKYKKSPMIFDRAKEKLKDRILHWGFAKSRSEYLALLKSGTILPVTSRQDFFGGSVVEGIASGLFPLLPNRLAFPEHVPEKWMGKCLYSDRNDFKQKLRNLILNGIPDGSELCDFVSRYDWTNLSSKYDEEFEKMIAI